MEDLYFLHYDCIQCMLNFEHIKFKYYLNLKFVNRLFEALSLCINSHDYKQAMKLLNLLKSSTDFKIARFTSLQLKCEFFSHDETQNEDIWKHLTNLQKLHLIANNSDNFGIIRHYPISTNLTYLKIKCAFDRMEFYPNHFDNFKRLKLCNIFVNCKINFLNTLTNLESLTRTFTNIIHIGIVLHHEYHSKLTYLKIDGMSFVHLHRMTQLKCKIWTNVGLVKNL